MYADFPTWHRMSRACLDAAGRMSWERRAGLVMQALTRPGDPASDDRGGPVETTAQVPGSAAR
jgi:hypothetical protein